MPKRRVRSSGTKPTGPAPRKGAPWAALASAKTASTLCSAELCPAVSFECRSFNLTAVRKARWTELKAPLGARHLQSSWPLGTRHRTKALGGQGNVRHFEGSEPMPAGCERIDETIGEKWNTSEALTCKGAHSGQPDGNHSGKEM